MTKKQNPKHIATDEARAGATPHILRYVLAASLVLAIIAMAAVWAIVRH